MSQQQQPPKKKAKKNKNGQWASLQRMVAEPILQSVTQMYRCPAPIQRKAIPIIHSGVDVVVTARTGSGKTAAFLLPILTNLRQHNQQQVGVRCVILSPSRELASQTARFARGMCTLTDIRVCVCVGGCLWIPNSFPWLRILTLLFSLLGGSLPFAKVRMGRIIFWDSKR